MGCDVGLTNAAARPCTILARSHMHCHDARDVGQQLPHKFMHSRRGSCDDGEVLVAVAAAARAE